MEPFSFTDYLETRMRDRTLAGRLARRLLDGMEGDELSIDALLADEGLMTDRRTRRPVCDLVIDYVQALEDRLIEEEEEGEDDDEEEDDEE